MLLCCDNGNVQANIVCLYCSEFLKNKANENAQHDAFSSGESGNRPSLYIKAWATYGGVYLSLPRCFRGLITIRLSREGITLSPAIGERAVLLSDVEAARVYFVGDRPHALLSSRDDDDKESEGATLGVGRSPEEPSDNMIVTSWSSAVQIRWEGEPELPG